MSAGCAPGGGSGVLVLAASSLSGTLPEIVVAFEEQRGDVDVTVSYAGSSTLARQLTAGAPGDVLLTADEESMALAEEAGAVGRPVAFATNRLTLAVPAGNPGGVDHLGDLARHGLAVGLCAPEVPCGRLAAEVLAAAGVQAQVDTYEPNVTALATRIEAGELDVGLVYRTDVVRSDVEEVAVPAGVTTATRYFAAVAADAAPAADSPAQGFVAHLRSASARRALRAAGFTVP